jgi:TrmH family RNA methyltransferase
LFFVLSDMSDTITSTHNPRISALRRLRERRYREESGLFMAEGEDMLDAALRHGAVPRTVFSVPDPPEQFEALLAALPAGTEQVSVSPDALASAGSLGSGSRVIGTWELPDIETVPAPVAPGPVLYLHDVADPGNVGTVLRAALAFGAALVLLSPRAADPFGPKAVRAAMGAVFGQPLARADFESGRAGLGDHRAIALVPGAGRPLRDVRLEGVVLFVLGAERSGLPETVVAACDEIAHVPVDPGGADSLNVAMAATLCLYEYRASHA